MVLSQTIDVNRLEAAEGYLMVATYLPVRHYWHIPAFLGMTNRIQTQLKSTAGVVRYGLRADLLGKNFWTVSVWTGRNEMATFTGAEPHLTAQGRFTEWAGAGAAFVEWTSTDGRFDWPDVMERLKTPTFYYKPTT